MTRIVSSLILVGTTLPVIRSAWWVCDYVLGVPLLVYGGAFPRVLYQEFKNLILATHDAGAYHVLVLEKFHERGNSQFVEYELTEILLSYEGSPVEYTSVVTLELCQVFLFHSCDQPWTVVFVIAEIAKHLFEFRCPVIRRFALRVNREDLLYDLEVSLEVVYHHKQCNERLVHSRKI